MNWDAISFDWNQARAFLATAHGGSFSAAARVLRTTQPTVGRQIAALETSLNVTLFERAGRSFLLTAAGQDLLVHVQAMADAATRVSVTAAGQSQDIAGRVVITASELLAAGFLPPVLQKLRRDAPQITVEIVASDRLEDLTRRDADIAIRHVRPEHPDLIMRHIADLQAGFYASDAYIRQYGNPATANDLQRHHFVGPRDPAQMLSVLAGYGVTVAPEQIVTSSDSGIVMWEMMRAGLGIAVMPQGLWPDTQSIRPVLAGVVPITFPVWLVTHRELRTSLRIRTVFDALAVAFAQPKSPM